MLKDLGHLRCGGNGYSCCFLQSLGRLSQGEWGGCSAVEDMRKRRRKPPRELSIDVEVGRSDERIESFDWTL